MNLLGKLLMSLSIVAYALIPPIVDLTTDTHVFHDGWMPHARMHTVWLLGVTSGVGFLALYLLWSPGADAKFRTNLAACLSIIVFGAFYVSAFTASLYGGSLSDMSGGVQKGPLSIDGNLFTFTLAAILLLIGWRLNVRQRT
jgi:hypothetical protein